jgi:acyl carrier protein
VIDHVEILAGFAKIVEDVTATVSQDNVTVEKSFEDDLEVDSLAMVEIAVHAEEMFGVRIPDEAIPHLKTVGDAVNYVAANSE